MSDTRASSSGLEWMLSAAALSIDHSSSLRGILIINFMCILTGDPWCPLGNLLVN